MYLQDPSFLPPGASKNAHEWLYTYLIPAVAALIGPALTGLTKMGLDLSLTRRSEKLTERINKLCDQIRSLPDFPEGDCAGCTPRQALLAEMNLTIQELSDLQKRKHATVRATSFSVAGRLQALLLFYRPHGLRAWLSHLFFWCYAPIYLFFLAAVANPDKSSDVHLTPAENAALVIMAAGVLSIPLVIVNLIANGIHRKQLDAAAKSAMPATVITTVSVQQGDKISV